MTIYEKHGGFEEFHKIIYNLYLDLFDHPEISIHFAGVNIERLAKHQTQFLCRAIGGKIPYEGGPMKVVHKNLNISEYQFNEVATSFRSIFIKHGLSNKEADFIMRFIGRYKKVIVECKFSYLDRIMIPIYHLGDKFSFYLKTIMFG